MLLRRSLGNVFAVSGDNPSDDPSRHVPLRKLLEAPTWLGKLLTPKVPVVNRARHSWALKASGLCVGRPLDAFSSKKVYVRVSDLLVKDVYDGLVKDVKAALIIYLAVGTACSSWSTLSCQNNSRTPE